MTVMKETPVSARAGETLVSARTCSTYGWSTAVGSGPATAARTDGESATAWATAVTSRRAASSARSAVKR